MDKKHIIGGIVGAALTLGGAGVASKMNTPKVGAPVLHENTTSVTSTSPSTQTIKRPQHIIDVMDANIKAEKDRLAKMEADRANTISK